jgi:glucokinase
LIVATARSLLARAGGEAVDAIGVAIPGIYRSARGSVWAPNIPGWDDYPLRDEMRDALGDHLRIEIAGDRSAYILGEEWKGAARGCRNAIFIAVGTGIGAGLLVDGRVLHGEGDISGAIGWLALQRPWRDVYESCGCFEYHASGPGLVKNAREMLESSKYSGVLRSKPQPDLTAEDIFAALDTGDEIAAAVLDDAIALWGMAAANLVSLLDPEMIIFGGGVFGPASRFIERIHDEARRWAQPISMRQTRFAVSELGSDAGLYGAGRLAIVGT